MSVINICESKNAPNAVNVHGAPWLGSSARQPSGAYSKETMRHKKGSSKSGSSSTPAQRRLSISDVPNALLELEAKLLELEQHSDPGVAKLAHEAQLILQPSIQAVADAADQIALIEV